MRTFDDLLFFQSIGMLSLPEFNYFVFTIGSPGTQKNPATKAKLFTKAFILWHFKHVMRQTITEREQPVPTAFALGEGYHKLQKLSFFIYQFNKNFFKTKTSFFFFFTSPAHQPSDVSENMETDSDCYQCPRIGNFEWETTPYRHYFPLFPFNFTMDFPL